MEHILMDWKVLKNNNFEDLVLASNTVHHAAQTVTLAGKSLLPEKEDDSHTTMKWLSSKNWLIGRVIRFPDEYLHLVFDYNDFSIKLVNEDLKVLNTKAIDKNTKEEIFFWLKNTLCSYGIDAELLKNELHFDLPAHSVDEGEKFIKPKNELLIELSAFRTNGHLLLQHFANEFNTAQPLYVWPHHFDEGIYIPLLFEQDEVIGSISFGMAVADEFYDSPYFYVTAWKKDGLNYDHPPKLDKPGKWHKTAWNGQVLIGSDLACLAPDKQSSTAFEFMEQALNNARGLIGRTY